MARSKIEICNIALGLLGADSIRSFSEDNKRARMCELFFNFTRDALLAKFDWPFARNVVKLQNVVTDTPVPVGWQICQLPSDCATPRGIEPEGSQYKWYVLGDTLVTNKIGSVYLRYTRIEENVLKYSPVFCNLVALGTAIKLCLPITQDKRLFDGLNKIYAEIDLETMESEANIGSEYREHDNDPNVDSFVNVDGAKGLPWEYID